MTRLLRLLLVCVCAFAPQARAVIITLNPSADAFVTTGPTNDLIGNNYGGGGGLAVSAAGLPKGEFQSLARFDVSSAVSSFNTTFGPGQWMIDGITLTLTANPPNNAIFNGNGAGAGGSNVNFAGQFAIGWMQNDGWTEGIGTPAAPGASGITFATLNSFLGAGDAALGTFGFGGATTGADTWSLALAPALTADVAVGGEVSFRFFAADTAVSYIFNSRSVATVSSRPALNISAVAVPEPGAATLLALGAVIVASRRLPHARKT
ncbi:MAG: hypothetical protein ABMA13_04215 [Chthoniobacteraceae bacterium]